MVRAIFKPPYDGDNTRVWEVSSLISLVLHGLVLGVLGFALPANFAKMPETGVSIDLEMVGVPESASAQAKGFTQPEPEAPAPAKEPQLAEAEKAEPEKTVKPMRKPVPKKDETPKSKPVSKKTGTRKPIQPKKTADSWQADSRGQQLASKDSAKAKNPGKPTGGPHTQPAPLGGESCPRPPYPELARKRGQEGTVNVRCQIDSTGKVTGVSLAKSSGFKLLDEAALKAVGKWKFRPGSKDDASATETVIVPVQFKLQ